MATKPSQSMYQRALERFRRDQELRYWLRTAVAGITLGSLLVWFLLPLFWIIQTSLKTRPIAEAYPPVFWGFELQWSNYLFVLRETDLVFFLRNGIITATGATALALLLGVPHAYAISKYEFKYSSASLLAIIAVRIIPPISIAVPFFVMYNKFGLYDTLIGNIIVNVFLFEPFVVWIVKSFFDGLPSSLIEAARLDGCSKFETFYKIMLPLSKPAIGSATIVSWLLTWNEFTLIFMLTTSKSAQTLPVGIQSFSRDLFIPWNLIGAASVIGFIPSIIVVIFFQQYLVRGITEGEF